MSNEQLIARAERLITTGKIFNLVREKEIKKIISDLITALRASEAGKWRTDVENAPKDGSTFIARDAYGIHECCYDDYGRLCYKVWNNVTKPKFLTWYEWDLMCRFGIVIELTGWMLPPPVEGE